MTRRRQAVALAVLCLAIVPTARADASVVRRDSGAAPVLLGSLEVGSGVEFQGRYWFAGAVEGQDWELWATDGTPSGTQRVADVDPGPEGSHPSGLTVFGGRLYFSAYTPTTGRELFSTDGTTAGTRLFYDIAPNTMSAGPAGPVIAGGRMYFSANDGQHGSELWSTDGTPDGTHLTADVGAGAKGSNPHSLIALDDRLLFQADGGLGYPQLWAAAFGALGAVPVDLSAADHDLGEMVRLGDRVVFAAQEDGSGTELWSTRGHERDAQRVLDIRTGAEGSRPTDLTVVGTRAYFVARTSATSGGLWVTDGSPAGTLPVRDFGGGDLSRLPSSLRALGDQLLFYADDGTHGRELWTSRGDAASTRLVLDTVPGAGGSVETEDEPAENVAGLQLYAARDADTGREPWVTDGTAEGTHRLADLAPGFADSSPYWLGTLANTALFGTGVSSSFRFYAWTATGSTTRVLAKRRYSARQARKRKVVLQVTVTTSLDAPAVGGTVALSIHGRTVGTATLADGTARVLLTKKLRPGRTYAVQAAWSGSIAATASTSTPVTIRIRGHHRKKHH